MRDERELIPDTDSQDMPNDEPELISSRWSRNKLATWAQLLGPKRISAIYLAAVFVVVFTLLQPGTFLTGATMTVVFSSGVTTCLLALGFLVPLTAGAYDLSIGSMMTFAITLVVELETATHVPLVLIAIIAVVACALVGAISGFFVVKLHVNSFIATLGMSEVLTAGAILVSHNAELVGNFPSSWSDIGNNTLDGIPIVLVVLGGLGLIMWYVLEHTRVGRYLYATGGNAEAARLSGVPTGTMVVGSLVASAAICGFAGVIYSMQIGVATGTVGEGLLFPAVASVFLGASQFVRRPNVWGTLIAYFTLAFGVQGLTLSLGGSAAWASPGFSGIALVIAVAIASRPTLKKILKVEPKPSVPVGPAAPGQESVAEANVSPDSFETPRS